MYGEYIAEEKEATHPQRYYYNWASDIFAGELEDFRHNPRDYLESMGWDADEWLSKIKPDDVNYTMDDVTELAGLLQKYFEKYLEEEGPGDASIDTMCENEAEDFIANTIADCVIASSLL